MGRVAHLHLLELRADGQPGKVRDLFEGSRYELSRADPDANQFDISPDGRRIVFAFDPAPEKRVDGRFALAEMELKSGRITVIARDADWDFGARATAPTASASPSSPATRAASTRCRRSWRCGTARTAAREVVSAEWDHEVHAPLHWEDDGQAVLFTAEQKGRTPPVALRPARPPRRGAWWPAAGCSGFDKAAGTLVTLADTASHPARLHAHLPGEAPRRIETLQRRAAGDAGLRPRRGGLVQGRQRAAAATDDVQMWLVYPPGFDAEEEVPAAAHHPRRPAHRPRRQLALPLEHAALRRPGLRGGQRQLPRLAAASATPSSTASRTAGASSNCRTSRPPPTGC